MRKQELRSLYKEKRMALNSMQRDKLEDLMLIRFQQIPENIPPVVMSYFPLERHHEYDPHLVCNYCHFKHPDFTLLYPAINAQLTLDAIVSGSESEIGVNQYGIDEPAGGEKFDVKKVDMVFVPLLCFDERGYRVGYGKGYYDRFLATCRTDTLKIGFSFFEPVAVIDDINENDIRLNYCITPSTLFEF